MIRNIHSVVFSPTGRTRRAAIKLASRIGGRLGVPVRQDAFTLPGERENRRVYGSNDLVVFGIPVYAGRVPNKIVPWIKELFQMEGEADPEGGAEREGVRSKVPAVAIVTFGNRSEDSALRELQQILEGLGFCVFAAGAFAAPHAFAEIGLEHPTLSDKNHLESLADSAADALESGAPLKSVAIDGGREIGPYYTPCGTDGRPVNFLKARPKTDPALCDLCGLCACSCPMGSIPQAHPDTVTGICIKCQACIQVCPTHAKYLDDPGFLSHKAMLERDYRRPAESKIYLP